jgi:hypothetical protein
VVVEKMLKKSAKEALEHADNTVPKEISRHLDEVAEAGKAVNKAGDATKSFFENAGIVIREEKAAGKVVGQTDDFTCVATSLSMVLDDLNIIRSEGYLARALNTTKQGANILDIPHTLKNIYVDGIKTIARGGKKDISVKFSTLQSAMKTGNKKAIVSVRTEEFGSHALIVDKIEKGRVYIRDPFPMHQGSSYSVTINEFNKVFNDKFVTIK